MTWLYLWGDILGRSQEIPAKRGFLKHGPQQPTWSLTMPAGGVFQKRLCKNSRRQNMWNTFRTKCQFRFFRPQWKTCCRIQGMFRWFDSMHWCCLCLRLSWDMCIAVAYMHMHTSMRPSINPYIHSYIHTIILYIYISTAKIILKHFYGISYSVVTMFTCFWLDAYVSCWNLHSHLASNFELHHGFGR